MTELDLPPCACGRDHLSRRETCGYSNLEHVILDLARHVLQQHGAPEQARWIDAIDLTERLFGPCEGPLLLARVTILVRSILCERQACFDFLSPCCLHITDHEIALIAAVQRAKSSDWVGLKAACAELTASHSYLRTLSSVTALMGSASADDGRAVPWRGLPQNASVVWN